MYKKAKVHSKTTVETARYLESVQSVVDFSKQVVDKSLLIHVSDACFLVIRLLLHLELTNIGHSPVKTRSNKGQEDKPKSEKEQERVHKEAVSILESDLRLCLEKRESKLNPVFFVNILTKSQIVC